MSPKSYRAPACAYVALLVCSAAGLPSSVLEKTWVVFGGVSDGILASVFPWGILAIAMPIVVLTLARRTDSPLGVLFALVAMIGGVLGAIIWPFVAAWVVNPGTVDLIRLCGDAVGREHITDLRVRVSTFPPAVLCFPDGWASAPITATPTQSIILTVALIALVALAGGGVTSLVRIVSGRAIPIDAEPNAS